MPAGQLTNNLLAGFFFSSLWKKSGHGKISHGRDKARCDKFGDFYVSCNRQRRLSPVVVPRR